jgi:putative phosphoesterase
MARMQVGILSDTHGLLRAEVVEALRGVEHILHAGDIGSTGILAQLQAIALVTAVWGNTDGWDVRGQVPEIAEVELAGVKVVVIHGHQLGSPTPAALAARYPDAGLVVFGHTHTPVVERCGGVLAVNPGSAGPRRFKLPISLALAVFEEGRVEVRLRTLTF